MKQGPNIIQRFLGKIFPRFQPYYSYFDYYENQLEQFSLENLTKTFSDSSINNINSSQEISFFTFPLFSNWKQITKKLGEPRFRMKHPKIDNLSGAFFRKKLGHSKVTILFMFLENKLIFGSYIFDHFNSVSFKEIEKLLWNKYAPENNNFKSITDSNFNRIDFVFDVYYKINFISGDPSIKTALINQVKKAEQCSASKVQIALSDFI